MDRTGIAIWILSCLVLTPMAGKVPTVYDVLRLIYQVCSTDEYHRQQSLTCVDFHMGKEVSSSIEECMTEPKSDSERNISSVSDFCHHLTHVSEWASKHSNPPQQLTRVMGLAALGRMACVLGKVQRPVVMWEAAFAKCFPDYQSSLGVSKSSTKYRKENTLGENTG